MYLGIDILIDPRRRPWVVEVNTGLPGGAEEIDRIHRIRMGRPSGIFDRIEETSRRIYGLTFRDYLASLPFLPALKAFKLWMDGRGPFPGKTPAALRLEDKWVQYRILHTLVSMPETLALEPPGLAEAPAFLIRHGCAVVKLRAGRGGRSFSVVRTLQEVEALAAQRPPRLLQAFVPSRIGRLAFSVRILVFAGEVLGGYANLAERPYSNHGLIVAVEPGPEFGLIGEISPEAAFDEPSWEARLWFGDSLPPDMRRNLCQDTVGRAALCLPSGLYADIASAALRIERFYEGLDFDALPPAFFETFR